MAVWRFASAVTRFVWLWRDGGSLTPKHTRVRAADGHCSAIFPLSRTLLCDRGRVCGSVSTNTFACHFVDAVTGAVVPHAAVNCPTVDTSGALVWSDRNGKLIAAGSLTSTGHAMADVRLSGHVNLFRYGVYIVQCGSEWRALRFDGEPAPDAELDPKASAVACDVLCD